MNGRLLGLARKRKEEIRLRSVEETARRTKEVYAKLPQIAGLDRKISSLVGEVIVVASGAQGRNIKDIEKESIELQAQRAELLVEHGWPMDYLDGAWQCPKCQDTGYVQGYACACLLELYEEEKRKDLSALFRLGEEKFENFDLNLYSDAVDPEKGWSPRQVMELIYESCRDYAFHFDDKSPNLLFRGNTGLGKTFLSACIARVVAEKEFSVVYETAVAALGAFETQKFSRESGEISKADDQVRRLLQSDLVIIDDLGTEMATEMTKSALYTLINTRLSTNKKTIVSTNLTAKDMARKYPPQIVSRLEGEYQVFEFAGSDIRLLKKERGL